MSFNPFKERGIPVEKQLRNWAELNVKPYNKGDTHPYTKARIILMNGIEVEGASSRTSSPATWRIPSSSSSWRSSAGSNSSSKRQSTGSPPGTSRLSRPPSNTNRWRSISPRSWRPMSRIPT
jgi:hypothetical protein